MERNKNIARLKETFNKKINKAYLGLIAMAFLQGCCSFNLSQTEIPVPPTPTETPKPPFFAVGEIKPGDSWETAITRLFQQLYGPDFWGIGSLSNFASMIVEPRLKLSEEETNCIVFYNKFSAVQGVDLLYGHGVGDSDNLLGPLWIGQRIAAGKRNTIEWQRKALGCSQTEQWQLAAEKQFTFENDDFTQTIFVDLTRIKFSETEPGLTTAYARFRFINGKFNNWQGEWEVQIDNNIWWPVSKLRKKLEKGIDFNEAMRQLWQEYKQQSKNRLVDPPNIRGTALDSRQIDPRIQAKSRGATTKGFFT